MPLVEAKSYDEALALATRFMDLHRLRWPRFEGEGEVRPLEQMQEGQEAATQGIAANFVRVLAWARFSDKEEFS